MAGAAPISSIGSCRPHLRAPRPPGGGRGLGGSPVSNPRRACVGSGRAVNWKRPGASASLTDGCRRRRRLEISSTSSSDGAKRHGPTNRGRIHDRSPRRGRAPARLSLPRRTTRPPTTSRHAVGQHLRLDSRAAPQPSALSAAGRWRRSRPGDATPRRRRRGCRRFRGIRLTAWARSMPSVSRC